MAVKTSIFQIDLRDDSFNAFLKKYNTYEKSLKSMPAAWAAVNEKIKGSRSSFDALVEGMVAANVQGKLRAIAEDRAAKLSQTTAERWGFLARHAKSFAGDVGKATTSLLRWGALTGLISGVLGGGGLFGIDRLALGVAASRRSSLGLGTTIGGQKAFSANASQFLNDPDSFLRSVGEAKFDITKRVGLISAGLSPQQISGDTTTAAVAVLRNLKRLADTTNPALYANVLRNTRQEQFATSFDLELLHRISQKEFDRVLGNISNRSSQFDLTPDVALKWQDLKTTLSNAGQSINKIFVEGLAPLTPKLERLSSSFELAVKAFFKSGAVEKSIDAIAAGFDKIAQLIKEVSGSGGSPRILGAITGALIGGRLAGIPGAAAGAFIGAVTGGELSGGSILQEKPGHDTWNEMVRGAQAQRAKRNAVIAGTASVFGGPLHNPGNLRRPGQTTGFAGFTSDEAGIAAMAHQLQLYARRDKLDTIQGIVSKYAPPNENDTRAYVGDVARKTGFGAAQHLDLNDPGTLSRLIAAMVSHEQSRGHYDKYKDAKVVVEVLNNTGGNATISVNGLKN